MKVLVIGAHPDDEVLGAGGAILKHVSQGDTVSVCIVTKSYSPEWSEESRAQKVIEERKVDQLLGVSRRFNLGLPTVKLNTIPTGEFNRTIAQVVSEADPDIIYTHFEHDLNTDHGLVFKATLVAARPPRKTRILCYETVSETEWGPVGFAPNTWVNVSEFVDKKIQAFLIYESEVKVFPHPRSPEVIRALAVRRGSEAGFPAAEAFLTVRDFIS